MIFSFFCLIVLLSSGKLFGSSRVSQTVSKDTVVVHVSDDHRGNSVYKCKECDFKGSAFAAVMWHHQETHQSQQVAVARVSQDDSRKRKRKD